MLTRQRHAEAKQALAALPYWVKVALGLQFILMSLAVTCMSVVMATYKEEFLALVTLAASMIQHAPEPESSKEALITAIKIGITGHPWVISMVVTLLASLLVSTLTLGLMPWKVRCGVDR